MSSLLSEAMVLYYLHTVRDNCWPAHDHLEDTPAPRTEEDKLRTRLVTHSPGEVIDLLDRGDS